MNRLSGRAMWRSINGVNQQDTGLFDPLVLIWRSFPERCFQVRRRKPLSAFSKPQIVREMRRTSEPDFCNDGN